MSKISIFKAYVFPVAEPYRYPSNEPNVQCIFLLFNLHVFTPGPFCKKGVEVETLEGTQWGGGI